MLADPFRARGSIPTSLPSCGTVSLIRFHDPGDGVGDALLLLEDDLEKRFSDDNDVKDERRSSLEVCLELS